MTKTLEKNREDGWLIREALKAKEDIASWPDWIREGACVSGGSVVHSIQTFDAEPRNRLRKKEKLKIA